MPFVKTRYVFKKSFLYGVVFGLVLLFAFFFTLPDGRLHVVFCDVGQGDAVYIKTPSGRDFLIDGGPNDKVLSCLSRHMPFYDRQIDVVLLSHPQKDHLQGLISVTSRYKVDNFIIGPVANDSKGYKALLANIKKNDIPVKILYAKDKFQVGKVNFSILWPARDWVASNLSPGIDLSLLRNPNILGFQTSDSDTNNFSYYLHLAYGNFDVLFTGDGDSRIQPVILTKVDLPDVEVLKFPHHGSKYGATDEFLKEVKPELSIISVGKNPWGHPTKEALDLLRKESIKVLRTDKRGDIEIISDGKGWWLKDFTSKTHSY